MASVVSLALRFGRVLDPLGALLLACGGMLALDPALVRDLGFQLSAVATIGLITLQPRVNALLPFLPAGLRDPLAATLAAQLATSPILASAFHQFSVISPLSNLLAAPSVPIITVLSGLAATSVSLLSPLAPLFGLLLIGPTSYLLWVIEQTAAAPNALLTIPETPGVLIVLYTSALIFWAVRPTPEGRDLAAAFRARPRLIASIGALVAGIAVAAVVIPAVARPRDILSLALFDAGGNHALFGRTPGNQSFLVDGGQSPYTMTNELGRRMNFAEQHLSLAVLTAMDSQRVPAMVAAIERYPPQFAAAPPAAEPSPLNARWRAAVGPGFMEIVSPTEIQLEPAIRLELLPTTPLPLVSAPTRPAPTLAVRIVYGETSILFAPLANASAMRRLAAEHSIQSRILIVPRGASKDSVDETVLRQVAPEIAIITLDTGSRAPRPDDAVLGILARFPIFRSDVHGTIEIESDGVRIWVKPERTL